MPNSIILAALYFSAICGDRVEIYRNINEIKQGKPIDKTMKEIYAIISKRALENREHG